MVCEHIARQNTSSQRHDLCCSMKQVNGFHIGIFLRSEYLHRSEADPGLSKGGGGGGGGVPRAPKARAL